MKYLSLALIALLLVVGCTVEGNVPVDGIRIIDTNLITVDKDYENNGFCVMTANDDADLQYQLLEQIFSEIIGCNNNQNCYDYLLDHPEYRGLKPEFEPYLNCNAIDDSVVLKFK
jgi:hypothetical protein